MKLQAYILARSRQSAQRLAEEFEIHADYFGIGQKHIDSYKRISMVEVTWWKDEAPPVIPVEILHMPYFWQGDMPIDEFIEHIKTVMSAREQRQGENLVLLTKEFPLIQFELTEFEYGIMVRIRFRNGSHFIGVDDEDMEYTRKALTYRTLLLKATEKLDLLYPYLFFSSGTLPEMEDPEWRPIGKQERRTPEKWWVWCAHFYTEDGVVTKSDNASTNFRFHYPPTEEDAATLAQLNEQAKLADREGWFFCTVCQKARPKSEYGGFYFADVRCKEHADPVWMKKAREESYN